MAWPVVIATNGYGAPVTESDSEYATPYEIATNGYGTPVVFVASGGAPVKGVGVTWTPASEPNGTFSLWQDGADAASIILNGGLVSQWTDKSGAGNNSLQGTAGSRPDDPVGGGVDFSTGKFFANPLPSNVDARSIFAAIDMASVAGSRTLISGIGGGRLQFRISGGNLELLRAAVAVDYATTGAPLTTGKHIIGLTMGGTGVGQCQFYIDGSPVGSPGTHASFGAANTSYIGVNSALSEALNGTILELIDGPGAFDAPLVGRISAYLKAKWATP